MERSDIDFSDPRITPPGSSESVRDASRGVDAGEPVRESASGDFSRTCVMTEVRDLKMPRGLKRRLIFFGRGVEIGRGMGLGMEL
jgi:hypothetical protein